MFDQCQLSKLLVGPLAPLPAIFYLRAVQGGYGPPTLGALGRTWAEV